MEKRNRKNYVWSNGIDKIMFRKNDDLQPNSAGKLLSLREATKGIKAIGDREGKLNGVEP